MAKYSAIETNRDFSQHVLTEVRETIQSHDYNGVLTIAIAGSFGRLEASQSSDADVIILLDDDYLGDPADEGYERRREVAESGAVTALQPLFSEHGIAPPNPTGVFARSRSLTEILPPKEEGGFGLPDEPADLMGKRLLLLLESRYLWREQDYAGAIDRVFDRYAAYVLDDTSKEYLYLLNDLVRYFRYICVNYESTFGNDHDKWAVRNVKLRHSRLLMYTGLLAALGHASQFEDDRKVSEVRTLLQLSPLERLEYVYRACGDHSFFKIAGLYNSFLAQLSDPSLRTQLNALDYSTRYENQLFATLKANSDAFQSELAAFIYRRRGQWSDRFFEYLIL